MKTKIEYFEFTRNSDKEFVYKYTLIYDNAYNLIGKQMLVVFWKRLASY